MRRRLWRQSIRSAAPRRMTATTVSGWSGRLRDSSIEQFQPKLDFARRIHLAGDHAKLRIAESQPGIAEAHPVKHIEKLAPELQVHPSITPKPVILHHSDVEIVTTMISHVGQRTGRVAKRKRRRLAADARVQTLS